MDDILYSAVGRASVWLERLFEPLVLPRHVREHRRGADAHDRTGLLVEKAERIPVLWRDDEIVWADYPHPGHSLWRAQELSLFHQHRARVVPPVMDFGCGDGSFASILFDAIDAGVDNDPDALAVARQYGIYRRLLQSTDDAIPMDAASVRTVVSNSVLEHVLRLDAMLAEIRRVLAPGGAFLFSVPVAAFRDHLTRYFGRAESDRINTEYYHRNLLPPAEWDMRLRRAGFTSVAMQPFQPPWYTWWYRMFRFCGRQGLGRVIPDFRGWLWRRWGARLRAMVRRSLRRPRSGANVFVVAA